MREISLIYFKTVFVFFLYRTTVFFFFSKSMFISYSAEDVHVMVGKIRSSATLYLFFSPFRTVVFPYGDQFSLLSMLIECCFQFHGVPCILPVYAQQNETNVNAFPDGAETSSSDPPSGIFQRFIWRNCERIVKVEGESLWILDCGFSIKCRS